MSIHQNVVTALRQAARCVTGAARRSIQAMAAQTYCGGWAETMTWKQLKPIVWTFDRAYQLGVKLSRSDMKNWSKRLKRRAGVERWSVTIEPLAQVQT